MKLKIAFPVGILCLAILACNLNMPGSEQPTSQAFIPPSPVIPTEAPTPTPQPTPTPLPEVRLQAGDLAFNQGNWDLAVQEYQNVINTGADADTIAGAMFGIGRIHYLRGGLNDTLVTLTRMTDTYPEAPQCAYAYFYMGLAYNDLQQYANAVSAFDHYLHLHPGILDAYVQEKKGDALMANGNTIEAIGAFQAAMQAPKLGDTIGLEIKIANGNAALGDYTNAVNKYIDIYNRSNNEYTKAQMDLLAGQAYLVLNQAELAQQRLLDAVENYPKSYDSYTALVTLVNAGVPVSKLQRGIVDYYAGQYGLALDALNNYMNETPDHDATPNYYKALALRALGNHDAELNEWDNIIQNHNKDSYWTLAWDEKAYTLWAYLSRYEQAAQVMLDFIARVPDDPLAPGLLYDAGRNLERTGKLEEAAKIWDRMADDYPSSEFTNQALILAGISRYRLNDYKMALNTFQRTLVLAVNPTDQAQAFFWVGKTQKALGDMPAAQDAWQQAATRDPTGYYSERARDLLIDRAPYAVPEGFDLGYDETVIRAEAETWMQSQFHLPPETDLSSLGDLLNDQRMWRGTELWRLGFFEEARDEFEDLRQAVSIDPVKTYLLMNYFKDLGLYRSAIFAARQVLTLAGMDDIATLNAPSYFNFVRFGLYYKDMVVAAAEQYNFQPLLLFSVIRQESFFEGFVESPAGARGLMQIMPATGGQVATAIGWPPNYSPGDLYRPYISITMGAAYLDRQRQNFKGDIYAALAAYNGGPGNSEAWQELAGGDPDLFVEVIRFKETRQYLMRIFETFALYRRVYTRTP